MGNLDAKNFVHLPHWAKALALLAITIGIAGSVAVIYKFFDSGGNRDWVLIGISGGQFMITTFVVTLILFYSQTDSTINTLRRSGWQFLDVKGALGVALGDITLNDTVPAEERTLIVERGERRDLFGFDYTLSRTSGEKVIRLWCGVNVNRFVVIYRMVNDKIATRSQDQFVDRLGEIFNFSLGGAETVGYKVHYEKMHDAPSTVSVWLTVRTHDDLLTNPALKLFWAQDIAMMTESVLRTARRHRREMHLDVETAPLPL